jgi:CubicO group peptidase (beta-lactamase class C family)
VQRFAVAHLFGPLDITDFAWEVDPAGFQRGSAGLVMRPRDVAKFGQLYLQAGRWENQQLISPAWVETSTVSQVGLGDDHGYGRLWWVTDGETIRFFGAVGYGGQLLFVVPSHQLVIVANHEWRDVGGKTAVKQSTDFYNQVFARVVESAR